MALVLPAPIELVLAVGVLSRYGPAAVEEIAHLAAIQAATQTAGQFKTLHGYYAKRVIKTVLANRENEKSGTSEQEPQADRSETLWRNQSGVCTVRARRRHDSEIAPTAREGKRQMLSTDIHAAHHRADREWEADASERCLWKVQAALNTGDLQNARKYAFGLVFDSFAAAAVSVDADRRIWLFNERSEEVFGHKQIDMIGQPLERILIEPPSGLPDSENVEAAASAGAEGLHSGVRKLVGLRKDGTDFPVQATVSGYGEGREAIFAITLHDVSDEKRAEESFRKNEKRFEHLLEGFSAAVVLEDLDGRIRFANRRFEEWHGVSAVEAIGKTSSEIHPGIVADVYSALDQQVIEKRQPCQCELPVPFADGDMHMVVMTKFPVFDDDDQLVGLGVMGVDVSERRRVEKVSYEARNLRAVGQLAGGAAHEFNNIFATVLLNTELLQSPLGQDDKRLQKVARAASRGSKLTRKLLAFSRREQLKPRILNPCDFVEEIQESLSQMLGQAVDLEIERTVDLWPVLADPVRLKDALLELAANARDAMPLGGSFAIEMANLTLRADDEVARSSLSLGDYVVLTVRDTGCGIGANVIDRVLEPFFTTKDVGDGSGLGLAMVYGFTKESGGHVTVGSEPGCGTTVKLYLPRGKGETDLLENDATRAEAWDVLRLPLRRWHIKLRG